MLIDLIKEDVKKALREKKPDELITLRTLMAEIKNYQIKKFSEELKKNPSMERKQDEVPIDDEIISVISRGLKQMEENLSIFVHGVREDLLNEEKHRIEIYKRYLPQQLSEEEIGKIIDGLLPSIVAKTSQERFGMVMKAVIPFLKGKADGKIISNIVKEKLGV
jgi:hypothetical protein